MSQAPTLTKVLAGNRVIAQLRVNPDSRQAVKAMHYALQRLDALQEIKTIDRLIHKILTKKPKKS